MKNLIRILIHRFRQPKSYFALSSRISLDSIIGEKVKILSGSKIGESEIGRYSYVGQNCVFERTKIGSFCSIGPEVMCGMGTHPLDLFSTYPGFFTSDSSGAHSFGIDHKIVDKKFVQIGSDVWIGARALIVGGVKIGHGAVIGAGAVVTKDVAPYSIVGGVPAKHIRFRFDEEAIQSLLRSEWWLLADDRIKQSVKHSVDPIEFATFLSK